MSKLDMHNIARKVEPWIMESILPEIVLRCTDELEKDDKEMNRKLVMLNVCLDLGKGREIVIHNKVYAPPDAALITVSIV